VIIPNVDGFRKRFRGAALPERDFDPSESTLRQPFSGKSPRQMALGSSFATSGPTGEISGLGRRRLP
jgi:hypothetical protein